MTQNHRAARHSPPLLFWTPCVMLGQASVNQLQEKLDPLAKRIEEIEENQADLSERLDEVDDRNVAMLNRLEAKQERMSRRLLDIERASKKLNLKISGLLTPSDGSLREKKDRMLNEFLDGLKTAGIATEAYRITPEHINLSRAIRIPGQPGLVLLIRLKSEEMRDHIYKNRTKMKIVRPRKIYINEDLTKEDSIKLSKARKEQKAGNLTSVWSYNGKVYARAGQSDPFCLSDATRVTPPSAAASQANSPPHAPLSTNGSELDANSDQDQ